METIAQELQVPVTVVYHAHLVNSGDSVKALNYLLANPLEGMQKRLEGCKRELQS